MSAEFCNETLTSLSPPNLALHVATVPCKSKQQFESMPITKCMLAKLNSKISPEREVRSSEQMFEVLSINSHTGAQPSMPLVDGPCRQHALPDQTMWQSGTASSAAEQHLSSTIKKIFVSNKLLSAGKL